MSSIKDFYQTLSQATKDIFVTVANDSLASAPTEKIMRLENFYSALKSEIDQVNRRRKAIGDQLNNVEVVLEELDKYLGKNDSLELRLFRGQLYYLCNQLKTEIAVLRPQKKLDKKFDVARRKEELISRRKISEKVLEEIVAIRENAKTEKVAGTEVKIETKEPNPMEVKEGN